MTKILIFGATGATGKHALKHAIANGTNEVTVFVRNPSKLPAEVKDKVTVVEGDYTNLTSLKNVVHSSQPDGIIVAATVANRSTVQDFNNKGVPAILEQLKADGRLATTRLIYLGGGFSIPKGESNGVMNFFGLLLKPLFGIHSAVTDNTRVLRFLEEFVHTNPEVSFTFIRMGMVTDVPSKGKLSAWKNSRGSFGDSTAFTDVGQFLVELAQNNDNFKNGFYPLQYTK